MDQDSHAAKRESSMADSHRNGSANTGVCHGRIDRRWVHPGMPSDSLREPDFTRGLAGACMALLRLLSWYCLLGGVTKPGGGSVVFSCRHWWVSLCLHTAMLEVVMDV